MASLKEISRERAEYLRRSNYPEHDRNWGMNFCLVCGRWGGHCEGRSSEFVRRAEEMRVLEPWEIARDARYGKPKP